MMVVKVKSRSDGQDLGSLDLPHFCLFHMKNMTPKDNLKLMLTHVNRAIKPGNYSRIYINGDECIGIHAEQLKAEITILHVD